MRPSILLDEPAEDAPTPPDPPAGPRRRDPPADPPTAFMVEENAPQQLRVWLEGEPRIGEAFAYAGLCWEVVGYRKGWIAQPVPPPPPAEP